LDTAVLLLLVEDEALILVATQDALETGGFEVLPARSGEEAMRLLDEEGERIAGVITDVRLGRGPSGWEVGRHARRVKADLPIVYTSGDSAHEWTAEGVPRSVMIQKPYAEAQVLTAISTLLNESSGTATS
jgi:DNA-binding response OmpR family regulator